MVESKSVAAGLELLSHSLINNIGAAIVSELEGAGLRMPAFTGKQAAGNRISMVATFNGPLPPDAQADVREALERISKANYMVEILSK